MSSTIYWMGPRLRDAARAKCFPFGDLRSFNPSGAVLYEYINDQNRAPEYAATRIRLRAFYHSTGEPLNRLEEILRAMPGCVKTTRIEAGDHPTLRPQVVAVFDRECEDAGNQGSSARR